MLFNNAGKRNTKRLLNICEELVKKYESEPYLTSQSCWPDLKVSLENLFTAAMKEISTWKDSETDYIKIAHLQLANCSSNLLTSGKYHLGPGYLNPMSCANSLLKVYRNSLSWAVDNNYITEEEKEEEIKQLQREIKSL